MLEILTNLFDNFLFLILYISNGSTFPKPLTAAEEEYYLQKFRDGDMSARDVLIEKNLRLVAHVIKKYYASSTDQDDLISIGTIGLIKGISSYNSRKGTKLATYAARCIENEIFMYFRSQRKLQNETYISDPIDVDSDGNSITYMDIVYEDDNIIDSIDLKINTKRLYSFISELSEREKLIITLRYGLYNTKPLTQIEVSKKLGISRSYVSRIEKRVVETLRERFYNTEQGKDN